MRSSITSLKSPTASTSRQNDNRKTVVLDDNENLYSLDMFVNHIVHLVSEKSQFESQKAFDPNNCCIGVRLWEFPLMYINQKNGQGHLVPFSQSDVAANSFHESFGGPRANWKEQRVLVRSGKSCVFKMTEDVLKHNLNVNPLYVFLFALQENGRMTKPLLLGSCAISIDNLGVPETADPSLTIANNHFKHHKRALSGTFTILNDRGYEIGVVDLELVLRKLNREAMPTFDGGVGDQGVITRSFSLSRTLERPDHSQTKALVMDDKSMWSSKPPPPQHISQPGLGDLRLMIEAYKNQELLAREMKKNLQSTVADLTVQLSTLSAALNGKPKKKKKNTLHISDKAFGVESNYSSSLRIGRIKGYNGNYKLKVTPSQQTSTGKLTKSALKSRKDRTVSPPDSDNESVSSKSSMSSRASVRSNRSSKSNKEQKNVGKCQIEMHGDQKKLTVSLNLPDGVLSNTRTSLPIEIDSSTLQQLTQTIPSVQPVYILPQPQYVSQQPMYISPQASIQPQYQPQVVQNVAQFDQVHTQHAQPVVHKQPVLNQQPPVASQVQNQQNIVEEEPKQPTQPKQVVIPEITVDREDPSSSVPLATSIVFSNTLTGDREQEQGPGDDEHISIRESLYIAPKVSHPRYTNTLLSTQTPASPRQEKDLIRQQLKPINIPESSKEKEPNRLSRSYEDDFEEDFDEGSYDENNDHEYHHSGDYRSDEEDGDDDYMYDDDNRRSIEEDDRI